MEENIRTTRKICRQAGLVYLSLIFPAVYSNMYVPSRLMVPGDGLATARNIASNEFFFSTSIAASLVSHVLFLTLVLLLYRLFKAVDAFAAKLMTGLVMVAIPIAFMADVNSMTALKVFSGKIAQSFGAGQMQDLGMLLIKSGIYGGQMATLYWGLWLIPLGWLVYTSGFVPRVLGILLWVNGLGYVVQCFTFVLFPGQLAFISKYLMITYFAGEIPFIIWLLFKGFGPIAARAGGTRGESAGAQ